MSLLILAVLFRPLVVECVDSSFLRRMGAMGSYAHFGFLFLMVINLVAGFHALGTLMAIGIMILPAASARFWVRTVDKILLLSIFTGCVGCYVGLILSFYFDFPAGPAIVICLGIAYLFSVIFGITDGAFNQFIRQRKLRG